LNVGVCHPIFTLSEEFYQFFWSWLELFKTENCMASLWALGTAIAYAIAGVLIGQVCKKSHPLAVSLIVTIGTLIFFLLVGFLGPGIHLEAKSLLYGILIGILFAVGNVIYYKALSIGPMGTVSVTCSLAPLVPLGFDVLTGKVPNPIQYAGFLLIAAGLWLVVMKRQGPIGTSPGGVNPYLLAIPATLIFGINDVLFELADSASMLGLLLLIQISKLITTTLIALPMIKRLRSGCLPILKLLPIGAIYGIGWIALDWSAKQGSIDITSALEYSSPFFVAILAYIFLHERLSRNQTIGFVSALAGVIFLVAFPAGHHLAAAAECRSECTPMHRHLSQRLR